jgi:hypothetical protein
MRIMQRKFVLVSGIVAICAGSTAALAGVRVIHASPNTGPVDVYVNTLPGAASPAIEDLAFTQGTGYVPLAPGTYDFRVTPANATSPIAINAEGVAIADADYTIAAIGFFANIQPLVLLDNRTTNPNAARVRFVHAAPDVPAVDIGLNSNGTNTATLFNATTFGTAANEGYIEVPGGTYNLGVFLDANNALALPVNNLQLQNNFVYTVFAMGSIAQNNVQAVVFVDAIPSPGAAGLLGMAGLACARRRRAKSC